MGQEAVYLAWGTMLGPASSLVLPPPGPQDDDSEVESLLNQISEGRHAGDRREAMERLKELLADNPQVCSRTSTRVAGWAVLRSDDQ